MEHEGNSNTKHYNNLEKLQGTESQRKNWKFWNYNATEVGQKRQSIPNSWRDLLSLTKEKTSSFYFRKKKETCK